MKIHIVQQGDTLWKLAKKYDVDFEQLKAVNNHLSNPDVIMPGMKIKIPAAGVPVKKQAVKKEEPIKAQQPKEAPIMKEAPIKKEEVVIAPKEEFKVPAPPPAPPVQPIQVQPIQQPITQQQYLHHMNMNFNVYKPQVPPAPVEKPVAPKLPEIKELPKMEKPKPMVPPPLPKKEMPKPMPKQVDQPVAKPVEKQAPVAPQPMYQMPVQQDCYPVTGIMPGCAPYAPAMIQPGCSPYSPGMFQPGYPQYPGMAPSIPYGYQTPSPMGGFPPAMSGYPGMAPHMPAYPTHMQPGQFGPPGMMQPPPADFDDEDTLAPTVPSGTTQVPPMQVPQSQPWSMPNTQGLYGDITSQQPMMPPQAQPMMPQAQPWGYQPQPMYQQPFPPHQGQQQIRDEDEDTE